MSAPPAARAAGVPGPLLEALALAAIVTAGIYLRIDDLAAWREAGAGAFFAGRPLLVNLDGYYFLSLARDLLEGAYAPVDALRGHPDGVPRPWPPPLLALLTAAMAHLTGLSPDGVGAALPALAGPLLALPVHAVGRRLAGPCAGLTAALLAVVSHYYVYRSGFGFHDTDCLNVSFTMTLVWWSLRLADAPPRHFAAWLAAGAALYLLFAWWWFGAHTAVTVLAAWCLLCALLRRPPARRERALAAAAVAALAGAAVLWRGPGLPLRFADHLAATVGHVGKADQGAFPNVARSIAEQVPAGLMEAAEKTTGDPILLAFAAAGFAWLLVARPGAAPVLLAPLALALAGGLLAQRFLIFAAPVAGLGAGFLAARALAAVGRRPLVRAAVALGVAAVAAPAALRGTAIVFMPALDASVVAGLDWASRETPARAVLWTLWDYGHHARYWARRATVNDGSLHTGEITVYNALPFAAQRFRLAANFMQFYAVHGEAGLRRLHAAAGGPAAGLALARAVFAAGPGDGARLLQSASLPAPPPGAGAATWPEYLFPRGAPPLYLLLHESMLRSAPWWTWFGNWDPAQRDGHRGHMEPLPDLSREGPRISGPGVEVDLAGGTIALGGGPPRLLSRVMLSGQRGLEPRRYATAGPEFHFFQPDGFGALVDPATAASVFAKAYVLRAAAPDHFRRVHAGPGFQIWQVRGDRRER